MTISHSKLYNCVSKYFPYVEFKGQADLWKWKSQLLYVLSISIIIFGLVAYIPSAVLSIMEKEWGVLVINTLAYGVAFFIVKNKVSANFKALAIIGVFYILGIAIILLLGFKGAGVLWLFIAPVLAAIFFEKQGVIVSTVLNIVIFGVLAIPIIYGKGHFLEISSGISSYFAVVANFMVPSLFISLTLSVMVESIRKSLEKEISMTDELKEKQETLEKEKQKAEDASRLKSAFLSNMSHEVRTPMNAIVGFSTLLKRNNLAHEKMAQYANIIEDSSNQLLNIIEDIVDISKIQSNQVNLNYEPVSISDIISEIEDIAKNKISIDHKEIQVKIKTDSQDIIHSDRAKLKQILTKLVSNAIKFTSQGSIEIGYYSKCDDLEFYVKDTGKGIDDQSFELIFQQFVKGSLSDFYRGAGLGLSITHGLVELLGGKIWLESEIDKGTTFYFSIPFIKQCQLEKA